MLSFNFDQGFNFAEGLWWISLGIAVSVLAFKSTEKKLLLFFGAAVLALFGISDFVEIQTGAWWRPWWLLIWKAGCIILGLITLILYFKKRRLL
jgi:hypothetical protein